MSLRPLGMGKGRERGLLHLHCSRSCTRCSAWRLRQELSWQKLPRNHISSFSSFLRTSRSWVSPHMFLDPKVWPWDQSPRVLQIPTWNVLQHPSLQLPGPHWLWLISTVVAHVEKDQMLPWLVKYWGWVTHAFRMHPSGSVNGAVVNILHASVCLSRQTWKRLVFPHFWCTHTNWRKFHLLLWEPW